MIRKTGFCTLLAVLIKFAFAAPVVSAQPIRVIIAGLNHDHVHGILAQYKKGMVHVAGIVETDSALRRKYARLYQIPADLFYDDLKGAVQKQKPDAVLGYNAVGEHVNLVRICGPLHVPVMVEKPLAATLTQAKEIQAIALKYQIPVLTNYETTWYASFHDLYKTVSQDSIGAIKKMVAHDGHQGPKEIGCSPEFLRWLTDPDLNGAGALNDFGCYGADLFTWLMKGRRPVAVSAVLRHYKPSVYPKVDDDATIIVEYPGATGLIEASWNWPFSIKDMEIFGEHGYLHALNKADIMTRMRENRVSSKTAEPLPPVSADPIIYLTAVIRGQLKPGNDLSSLANNMVVMEILDAAKRSAQTGKRIVLDKNDN